MIYGIYFSPTSNTKKVIEAMVYHLDKKGQIIDITCSCPQIETFFENDFVVVGAPVYAGRIPNVARNRIEKIKGNHTPCVIVASYGNRHYDDALLEMSDILEKNGFIIHGAAAVIGRHTYGEIQVDRPNMDDLKESLDFISNVYKRNLPMESILPGILHDSSIENKGRFHPLTDINCIKCGICVQNCPVQAILEDCITISNQCISCFRCIRNCPKKAKNVNTEEYNAFAVKFTEKLKTRKENEYFM